MKEVIFTARLEREPCRGVRGGCVVSGSCAPQQGMKLHPVTGESWHQAGVTLTGLR